MHDIWIQIDKVIPHDFGDYLTKLKMDDCKLSPWIEDIAKINNFQFGRYKFPFNLVRKSLNEFGLDKPTELQEVYKHALKFGFKLVPPEIAIYTRELYRDQPTGEWLRFATPLDSMIDSDGVPHLPKLGRALGCDFVETYWAYPKAIFHPHNEFVMAVE